VPSTFLAFALLPKELRTAIWQASFPDPRTVEIFLRNRGNPSREIKWDYDRREVWDWMTTSAFVVPTLVFVCREAREVFLQSYKILNIWDESGSVRSKFYFGYSRDVFYLSTDSSERLLETFNGRFACFGAHNFPIAPKHTRFLAVNSKGPHAWVAAGFTGFRQFSNPGGRQLAIDYLRSILQIFENLVDLFLVIDGRSIEFEGHDELVSPTEEHRDFYAEDGLERYCEWISTIADELKRSNPSSKSPLIRLRLLTMVQTPRIS